MLTVLLFFAIQTTLGVCFFRCRKRKKVYSIISAAAFLLVCCLLGLALYISGKGYSYELDIDQKKLEAFYVDLDTPEQYEEWFCPEYQYVSVEGTLNMRKEIKFEGGPYCHVNIGLEYRTDEQAAIEGYGIHLPYMGVIGQGVATTKKMSAEYEYAFTDTHSGTDHELFGFLPDGYDSAVMIRYKNLIFTFSENSSERESRLGETIDLLWADYEQYKNAHESVTL
jgi:hypothetical protein